MKTRMRPHCRKKQILWAACTLSAAVGYRHITRQSVAELAGVAPGLVSYYFGDMDALRNTVMGHALATGISSIIAQGLVAKNPIALAAPMSVRLRARNSLNIWGPL